MIDNIKPKSEFGRNVLTLMTGTIVAQAIPIAISPILTRIYTPEDFGIFALFFAILSIFSVTANGRYENAVMLPKKDEDAINIFALGLIINFLISMILMIIVILFNSSIVKILDNEEIAVWLYFIPIALFFTGLFTILNSFNNRQKNYRDIADAIVVKSLFMAVVQLSIGFIKSGATGLISGNIISVFFANGKLARNIIRNKKLLLSIKRVKIIALAKKYKDFPKFSLPSAFANVLAGHLSNILIFLFYSATVLGFYSFVQRILGMPTSLVGKSIGQVYFEEGTREKNRTGRATTLFNSTLEKLIIIGFPSFLTLFFIVEELFAFVFSEEWRIAGEYAQIAVPMFFIRFVVASLSITYDMFGYLKLELIWQITLLIGSVFIVMIYGLMEIEFKNLLIILTIYISIMQLISLYLLKRISSGEF
jgi:O-antigen/teichoic acid export membrane protein